jgi:hypothetical protein
MSLRHNDLRILAKNTEAAACDASRLTAAQHTCPHARQAEEQHGLSMARSGLSVNRQAGKWRLLALALLINQCRVDQPEPTSLLKRLSKARPAGDGGHVNLTQVRQTLYPACQNGVFQT